MRAQFRPHLPVAASALFACLVSVASAQQSGGLAALAYDSDTRGPVPDPSLRARFADRHRRALVQGD